MTDDAQEHPPADPGTEPAPSRMPGTAPEVDTDPGEARPRPHLVVVVTRPSAPTDRPAPGVTLLARFWHPGERSWKEHGFESLEHALRLFVSESGWRLLQQQALAGALAWELIFQARREDFSRPSAEAILRDVGLTPEDVADFLGRVERGRNAP